MDGDGGHEVSFYLIGDRKENPSYNLRDRQSMTPQMRQYKKGGAQDEGDDYAPSSEEAIEDSPEKDLFCDRCHNSTDQEKYEDVTLPSRQGIFYELEGVMAINGQDKKTQKGDHPETDGPGQPLYDTGKYLGWGQSHGR